MPTRYKDGAARSHEFGTPESTCLLGVRTALHDLTGSEHKIVHAYGAARSHGFGTPDRTCLQCIRSGLQDLTGKEHQILNAYEISGPDCRVSRVRDTRSNTPTK